MAAKPGYVSGGVGRHDRITASLHFVNGYSAYFAACCPKCGHWVRDWSSYTPMNGGEELTARCNKCETLTVCDELELTAITDKLSIEAEIIDAT